MALISNKSNLIQLSTDIKDRFNIEFNNKLEQLSNEFATAYKATRKSNPDGKYYCLIFDKSFSLDLNKISILKEIDEDVIQNLVEFGKIIDDKKHEVFCVIYEYPKGRTLTEILASGKRYDENIVINIFLSQIILALDVLHKENILYGQIHPDKIYYDSEKSRLCLTENVSTYPGFTQPALYETYERMDCHKAGKSGREFKSDYYSLGVLIFELLVDISDIKNMPDDIVKMMKFENGSFEALISTTLVKQDIKIAPRNENLLKGLLHDKVSERWESSKINKWQKKEISQSSPSRVHRQASSLFEFNEVDFLNPKFLANTIQKNWLMAKKNIRLPDLSRWIGFISKFPDIEKKLYPMTKSWQSEVIIPDEKLSRILYMLDEGGPLRYKDIAFHPDGLGNLLAYLIHHNEEDLLDNIIAAIDFGLIEGWIGHQEDETLYKTKELGWSPRKIKFLIRKKDLGFGLNRVLYETNHYYHCQGNVLKDSLCLNLPSLLVKLNEKNPEANEEFIDDISLDVCTFICARLNIEESIKVKQLNNFPSIAKMQEVKILSLFALAQNEVKIGEVKNLSSLMRRMMQKVAERFYSKNIRAKFEEKLDKAADSGSITKIFKVITNKSLIRKDFGGYKEAKKQYRILNFEILKLKSQTSLDMLAYRLGLRISVIFSYLICIISVISIMIMSGK